MTVDLKCIRPENGQWIASILFTGTSRDKRRRGKISYAKHWGAKRQKKKKKEKLYRWGPKAKLNLTSG